MQQIVKPTIIVGSGRSGTTLLHNIMSNHPELAWLTALMDIKPRHFRLNNLALQAMDIPVIGPVLRDISYFEPGECYRFWDVYAKGFGSTSSPPFRDLTADDVSKKSKERILGAFSQLLSGRKNRLLIKISGWPRVAYLREVFPDAKIVHIVRDGRAVANSFLNVDWWWGWRGPGNWRHGELSEEYRAEWDRHRRSFVALAGIEWKILLDAFEQSVQGLDASQYKEIRYEDLCADKTAVLDDIMDFCELDNCDTFRNALDNYSVKNTNYKWERELSKTQIDALQDVLDGHLKKYGYT